MEQIDKQAHWEGIIKSWKESGKSQKAFCEDNEVNFSTLGYWIKKSKTQRTEFAPVKVRASARCEQVFYKIETPIGVRVYIPSGARPDDLNMIFKALGVIA